jgi:acetyl esterase/lipase
MRPPAIVSLLLLCTSLQAATMIPLYPDKPPGSESWTHQEQAYFSEIFNTDVVTNVSVPTLTPFLPEEPNGASVIIAPGGGFHALSINSEGNDVATWLNERGVTAFVLRYRLVPTGAEGVAEMMGKNPEQARTDMAAILPLAGADGLRALKLVRERAEEFNIDPDRVGFMGFSAGGAVAVMAATNYDDASRPAFVAPIYAGVGNFTELQVPADAPPLFVVAASDDQLGLARDSVTLYNKWLQAGKSVEMHLYASGGHGFGMRQQNLPTDTWIARFGEWLNAQGFTTN